MLTHRRLIDVVPPDQLQAHHLVKESMARPNREAAFGAHLLAPGGDLLDLAVKITGGLEGQYGLIGRCFSRPRVSGLPDVAMEIAVGPRRDSLGRPFAGTILGTGVSDEHRRARVMAIVEAVERYGFRSAPDQSLLIRASLDHVKAVARGVVCFGLFSDEQYDSLPGLTRPGDGEEIDWTWAYSLTHDRPALVPAALAFAGLAQKPANTFVYGATSTGVATHLSMEAALLSGIYEVVERDSLMIAWLQRRRPARVRIDARGAPRLARLVRERFSVPGTEFVLLDMTSDSGIPVIACVGLSQGLGRPAAVFGVACRADPEEAAIKALFEAAQVLYGLDVLGWTSASNLAEKEIRTFEDHARFYAGSANARHLSFLLENPAEGPLPEPVSPRLSDCVERLARVGGEVLAVEITTADFATCGLRTFKVLVPGFVDINADPRFPYLGSSRITSVPQALGWTTLPSAGLNLSPCPLA